MKELKDKVNDLSHQGYSSSLMTKIALGVTAGIMISFMFVKTQEAEMLQPKEYEKVDDKIVQVVDVQDACTVEVIYNEKKYELKMPIQGWNDEMSEYTESLLLGEKVLIKDINIYHEDKEIYPTEVYVDGKDAVELVLAHGPKQ